MTEEFKKWFEGSTVVDEHGNPLKVYHGSPRKFRNFNFHTSSMIFFATNRKVAEYFADGNEVKECYLNIRRPFEFDAKGCLWDNLPQDLEDEEWYDGLCIEDLIGEHALGKGFDGAYIKDIMETDSHDWSMKYLTDDYVVFDPSQIWIIGEDMEEKRFTENKDARINKLNLTDEEKQSLKALFREHPELESKVDWNRGDLTFDDFKPLFDVKSHSSKKKASKRGGGLDALENGKDYEVVKSNDRFTLYAVKTYEASCILASNAVKPELLSAIPSWARRPENEWWENKIIDPMTLEPRCEGAHWCISMTKTKAHWNEFEDKELYICVDRTADMRDPFGKVCMYQRFRGRCGVDNLVFWNADDNEHFIDYFKESTPDMYEFIKELPFGDEDDVDAQGGMYSELKDILLNVVVDRLALLGERNKVKLYYNYGLSDDFDGTELLDFSLHVPDSLNRAYGDKIERLYRSTLTAYGFSPEEDNVTLVDGDMYFTVDYVDEVKKVYDCMHQCFEAVSDLDGVVFYEAPVNLRDRAREFFQNVANKGLEDGVTTVMDTEYATLNVELGVEEADYGTDEFIKVDAVSKASLSDDVKERIRSLVVFGGNSLGYERLPSDIIYVATGDGAHLELHGEEAVGDSWTMMTNIYRIFRELNMPRP